MTREEAIEVIEQDIPCEHDKDLIEALEMAISALSAEGEYIKKDDAISKILTEFVSREENGKVMCACADVKQTCADVLDSLPTYSFPDSAEIKGEDRPKGHWIGHREHCENLGVKPSGLGAYEWCSNCDCGIDVREWHRNDYNYCPKCGADMRGE